MGTIVSDDFGWVVYVRISDDREGAGLGVKRQEKDCRDLAARLGGRVVALCPDNDLTANDRSRRYKQRPEYQRMCEMLAAGAGRRGVLAWHTDRLHRTPRELEDFIDLIEKTGALVHTVKAGHLDLSTASGRMTARVHCAVARHESEHKSERIRRKVEETAAAGKINAGGPRPFGFRRIYSGEGNRRKIIRDEIEPAEAAIVRECVTRALDRESLRSIVRDLNARKITTSTGHQWSQTAMRNMLRSARIAGLREHHGVVVAKAVWPAIISKDDHEVLRALLDSRERPVGARVRTHYLSGYVYCSACMERLVKMRACTQAGQLKYKCLNDAGGCNGRVVGLAGLEDLVGKYIVGKLSDDQLLVDIAQREVEVDTSTTELVAAVEADERRLAVLQVGLSEGDSNELPEVLAAIRTVRARLGKTREALGRQSGLPGMLGKFRGVSLTQWNTFDIDAKRAVLDFLVEKIIIHPGRRGLGRFDPSRVDIIPAHIA